jgi:multidrug efflux pump subunit AcrB
VKSVNGATVFVKDVGQVHDGNAVQQNIVRTDGRRSVLLSIIKNGNASTLAVVNAVKQHGDGGRFQPSHRACCTCLRYCCRA